MSAEALVLLNQAFVLHQAGRLADAEAAYARVLAVAPDDLTALVNAGAVALARGDLPLAIGRFQRVVRAAPHNAIAFANLGLALVNAGREDEALAALDRALTLKPEFAQAHNNRGLALLRLQRPAEALASFERALALDPHYVDAAMNLADRLNDVGDHQNATPLFDRVLRAQPDNAQAQSGHAFAQALAGDLAASIDALERLAQAQPRSAAAWQSLGAVRNWAWQHQAAETAFRRAAEIDPGNTDARFGIASTLLARGNYREGWAAFEERPDRTAGSADALARVAVWDGRDFDGTLVVYGEQGFGDVVQFARFIPAARARVSRVVVLLDGYRAPLAPLLGQMPGVDAVATRVTDVAVDSATARVSVLSLPHRLGIEAAQLAAAPRYIVPPADRASTWRRRMNGRAGPRVGLAWSVLARDGHGFVTRHKSVPPNVLAPVLDTAATTFVTLQPGDAGDPSAFGPRAARIADLRPELRDFADTAALIDTLDLVISADTAVAHLAGALAKPVWLLDRFNSCWRWRAAPDASPWYPTLRIFRQPRFGDWAAVSPPLSEAFAAWRAQL